MNAKLSNEQLTKALNNVTGGSTDEIIHNPYLTDSSSAQPAYLSALQVW